MLRILLVEDEPPILRDLQNIIKGFGGEYAVFATAGDGQTALEILAADHASVDLVITDLHIPMVDGLELIGEIHKLYPALPCIILTGYSEFAYAKRALQLGVMDYLLKPVEEAALEELLQRAYEQKALELMQSGATMPAGTEGEDASCYVAAVCLGALPYHASLENIIPTDVWYYVPFETVLQTLEEEGFTYIVSEGYATQVKTLMIRPEGAAPLNAQNRIAGCFSPLLSRAVPATVALSHRPCHMHEVGGCIQELYRTLRGHLVFGASSLLRLPMAEAPVGSGAQRELATAVQAVGQAFPQVQRDVFAAEFGQLLALFQKHALPQYLLEQYLENVLTACIDPLAQPAVLGTLPIGEQVNEAVLLSDDYDTLADNFLSILYSAEKEPTGEKRDILPQVDEYILQAYTKAINTKAIAQRFGFTPAYLSRIYRDYRGISPSEYIAQLRMEKARALFDTDATLSVRAVAEAVGYDDPLYFSKVFKKATGLSPSQYTDGA